MLISRLCVMKFVILNKKYATSLRYLTSFQTAKRQLHGSTALYTVNRCDAAKGAAAIIDDEFCHICV